MGMRMVTRVVGGVFEFVFGRRVFALRRLRRVRRRGADNALRDMHRRRDVLVICAIADVNGRPYLWFVDYGWRYEGGCIAKLSREWSGEEYQKGDERRNKAANSARHNQKIWPKRIFVNRVTSLYTIQCQNEQRDRKQEPKQNSCEIQLVKHYKTQDNVWLPSIRFHSTHELWKPCKNIQKKKG